MSYSWTKNSNGLTIFLDGKMHTVSNDSVKYSMCIDAIKSNNEEDLHAALTKAEKKIELVPDNSEHDVVVSPFGVTYKGVTVHNSLAGKILKFYTEGLPYAPLVKFMENIYSNPVFGLISNPELRELAKLTEESARDYVNEFVNDLFTFLDKYGHPITDDGCFLAYKRVRSDGYDFHSRTILNQVGETVSIKREKVDPSRDKECSYGLHVGNLSYSGPNGHFGDSEAKCLIVKVNPMDVVRVPKEDSTKMRVCKYDIIQEYKEDLSEQVYDTSRGIVEDYEDEDYDDDYEDDDYYDEDEEEDDWMSSGDIEPCDIEVNDKINFLYKNEDRYLDVTNVDENYVEGKLLSPEKNFGQHRKFQKAGMSYIEIIDCI